MIIGGLIGTGNSGKAVSINNAQRLNAEGFCLFEKLVAGACATQKGKMRGDLQLGITRRTHAKTHE